MTFKFENGVLHKKLIEELRKTKSLGLFHKKKGGFIVYDQKLEEGFDNLFSEIRSSVFPKWQILSFPQCEFDTYISYIKRRSIPHEIEVKNGERQILLSREYKPLSWKVQWNKSCFLSCG